MNWKRRAIHVGVGAAAVTFLLLAPFRCETHYGRFVPGAWEIETVSTACEGLVAFEYSASRDLVGPRMPEGGQPPRPSPFQPQTVITSIVVGTFVALITWLLGGRPRVGLLARALITIMLVAITFLAATSPGGAIIYAAPLLIPVFAWMAYQAGVLRRLAWAVLGSLVAVEAVALMTWGATGFRVPLMLLAVGLSVGVFVLTANRWNSVWKTIENEGAHGTPPPPSMARRGSISPSTCGNARMEPQCGVTQNAD